MRRFLVRLTLIASAVAVAIVTFLGILNRAPWPLVVTRASIACLIVAAVGVLAGFVLMRTALRRHYEQSRRNTGLGDGARVER